MKGKKTGGRRPGSRNKATADVKALAQAHTASAIQTLARIMGDTEQPPASRVMAAKEILDRAHGKAPQALTGADGGDLALTIKQIVHEHHAGT